MSGGNLQGYTQLAYMEEEIDRELDGMELSARSVGAIQQMKMLYMNMYKLTKSLDYLVSGDIGEQQFLCDWNKFRSETSFIPRD